MPFCKSKCHYCAFVSFADKSNQVEAYVNSLILEINNSLNNYPDINLKTIYIGGGTPTLVNPEYYERIFSVIYSKIQDDAEITIEANPGTITPEYLSQLRNIGINRLSIGVQSFNDDILRLLNRQHTAKEALSAIDMAINAGFDNISIDLIYSLPNQSIKIWKESLNIAAGLNIQHISAYGLKIEEGTRFFESIPPNIPDEEISAQMYLKTIEILEENNFNHYEISNYAKSGYESRHNLSYWRNEEYLGFGLAAHGYINGERYSNICNFDKYINNPLKKAESHHVSKQEAVEEGIFLGLRLTEGINIDKFSQEYNIDLLRNYETVINKYANCGYLEIHNGFLRLTRQGILLSNLILADFLE